MSNFDRVLSDVEIFELAALGNNLLRADSEGDFYLTESGENVSYEDLITLLRNVEQAAIIKYKEKLAEQEPVAWSCLDTHTGIAHLTQSAKESQALSRVRRFHVAPLYAQPMPCVSNESHKAACVSKNAESEMQHHLEYLKRYQKWRRGEDKTMTEAGLEPKQIGEALDWLILFAENHIVDKHEMVLEGWQPIDTIPSGAGMPEVVLVATSINSVYTAYSMGGEIGLITPLDGCSFDYKAYGEPNYWMPLPATPKYTGENK